MQDMLRALRSELLKTKNSLALWMSFIAPLAIVGLVFLVEWNQPSSRGAESWMWHGQSVMTYWTLLLLTMFISLECALLAGLDHQSDHWKTLFSLPVSRKAIYWAKIVTVALLVGIATVVLVAGTIVSGVLLRLLTPGMGFESMPPISTFALYGAYIYVAALLIMAIHTWIAIRWSSFVVNMGVGIVMMVAAAFVIMSEYAPYFPWSMPFLFGNGMISGDVYPNLLWVSSIGFVVLGLLGSMHVAHRDVN